MTTLRTAPGIDRERVERVVTDILRGRLAARPREQSSPLVINVSARHVHITQEDVEVLFGPGAELTPMRWLYQEGQFAAEQAVDLIGPKRRLLQQVRILGPTRPATQVELALSDAINLGIDVPVRMSGKLDGTPGCLLLGPEGHLNLEQGVVRAQRHVHMSPVDASHYGVESGDQMNLVVEHATCPVVIRGIKVRVDEQFKLEVHIDTDEGNACGLSEATEMRLEKVTD